MKDLVLEQIKTWEELLLTKKAEKQETKSRLGTSAKMLKLAKELEKSGALVELPNMDEDVNHMDEVEKEIKVCKSTIRRLLKVYDMYYGENQTSEDVEEV